MRELCLPISVPEKTVVPNALEAVGQHVEQEAPDEFIGRQGHCLDVSAGPIVFPLETNLTVLDVQQAVVRDGDAVSISAHIVEDLVRTGERAFGINHPLLPLQRCQMPDEGEAVAVATNNLGRDTDEGALFTFDSELRQVVGFTTDTRRIRNVSLKGKPWGQTSLYDAVGHAARAVANRSNKHRALLVISDGVDTASRMSAAEVSGIASSIDVPVYLLRVVNPLDHPGGEFEVSETDGRTAQAATLADLARWTGGDIRVSSVPAHTSMAIQDLFTELRHQYLITFEPGARPGWHPLEIRTRKKSLVVHARGGYMSGPTRSGS